ncbi:hypothetical protein CO168_02025 [Candidatus Shapirobacteria bacterium CG_4_9_14_3_um_filter_36_12]|uniref:Antitoxin n=1 Tax=Candidatus Shapirobacteria bacterium CG_4_9_14_3_um_filter_36_12 TaxID=1974877 RepID=A0A2M7XNB7_9BACT|nr:MAG: hypothetical protein CO168_02025 [Candidatus Shapirobacteria bacterium CG_4_9_14_3_um_filter_36_12]
MDNTITVNSSTVRKNFYKLLDEVHYNNVTIIVTISGIPVVKMVGISKEEASKYIKKKLISQKELLKLNTING